MEKQEVLLSIIVAIMSSGIFSVAITHFLYVAKLKKDLKIRGTDTLARDIEKSLIEFREVVRSLSTIELYKAEKVLCERGSSVNFFGGECVYPEVFNDWNSFNAFRERVLKLRSFHEKNLNCKLALNLVFIDRYLLQLSMFMSGNEDRLPFWGVVFFSDLKRWQQHVDVLLVKEINKCNYKLESHETKKWHRLRKTEVEKHYRETILCYLLTGECKKRDIEKMTAFRESLVKILSEKTDL